MIKEKQTGHSISDKQHGLLPMVMVRRLTVDCVEGGEKEIRKERPVIAFCIPLSLSLFSSLPPNMEASLGGERRRFGHVEVVIRCWRPPVSFSFPTSSDLPALSLPSSPCCLRSLSVSMCTRPSHCNKTVQVCMFAASLFLLRWSKSAPCATERGFNSCASYCSLLLTLPTK